MRYPAYLVAVAVLCAIAAVVVALVLRERAVPADGTGRRFVRSYFEIAVLAGAIVLSAEVAGPINYALGEALGLDAVYGTVPEPNPPGPTRQCSPGSIACLPAEEQRRILTEQREARQAEDLLRGGTYAAVALVFSLANLGLRTLVVPDVRRSILGRVHLGAALLGLGLAAAMWTTIGLGNLVTRELLSDRTLRATGIGPYLGLGLGATLAWTLYLIAFVVESSRTRSRLDAASEEPGREHVVAPLPSPVADDHSGAGDRKPAVDPECARCATVDETVRVVSFTSVTSAVIFTTKRDRVGVYCARCRPILALRSSIVTSLFGWWGIPWGIVWSLRALRSNGRGGAMPSAANAELLRRIGALLDARGHGFASVEAVAASRSFEAMAIGERLAPEAARADRPLRRVELGGVAIAAVLGVAAVASVANAPSSAPPAPTPRAQEAATADFVLRLPSGWFVIPVDPPERVDAGVADLERRYGATETAGLRDRAAAAELLAVYVGRDITGRYMPVLIVASGTHHRSGGLRALLNEIERDIVRDGRKRILIRTTVTFPAGTMGLLRYETLPPSGLQVSDYVVYREVTRTFFVVRFETDAADQELMNDHYAAILLSFRSTR